MRMGLKKIITELNKIEVIRNFSISKHFEVLKELDVAGVQLKDKLPEEVEVITIDEKLLIELALLKGDKALFDMAHKYKLELDKQAQLFNDIEEGKLNDAEVHIAVHKNQSARRALTKLGNELFIAVYGDNDRYRLLASHINKIGENTLFKEN